MNQNKLKEGNLLDNNGNLQEAGYAFSLVKKYDRNKITAPKSRIKEWDYYYVGDKNYGIALTIADNSYMAMASVSVLDYINKTHVTKSYIKWLTNGKISLPNTSQHGSVEMIGKGYNLYFENVEGKRHLIVFMKNVSKNKDFTCDLFLNNTTDKSMVIATPFKKKKHFYYNQKINLLSCTGNFNFGEINYKFSPDALGVLDWGRGVWTYKNTWYWSSMNGNYNGHRIGFNLGYGFGDTSKASENMFFYDDKVYKFDDVKFIIPIVNKKEYYLKKWLFISKNQDIDVEFTPFFDRYSNTNALFIQSKQHQVFGTFSGHFKTEDGVIEFNDIIGFAEKVFNRW